MMTATRSVATIATNMTRGKGSQGSSKPHNRGAPRQRSLWLGPSLNNG